MALLGAILHSKTDLHGGTSISMMLGMAEFVAWWRLPLQLCTLVYGR